MMTADKMSDPNREQVTAYINGIWKVMLDDVSKSRKISVDSLNAYADRFLALSDQNDLLKMKMVDKLMYTDEVKGEIKKLLKIDADAKINQLTLEDMKGVKGKKQEGDQVAVYYAYGDIVDSETGSMFGSESSIVAQKVCKDLEKLMNDDDVKAVVLRVNSPGGSAYASEQIWRSVTQLKTKKPVVVSMGGYAASGGYYISCAANYIYAEPTTITGSIGIFGMFPNAGELLNDKLGVHFSTVKTNEYSDFGDISRPFTEQERAIAQRYINSGYELFTKRCADGRKMKQDDIKKIGEGRVWTGIHAKQIGLVDELGGLNEAIAKAKQLAKVDEASIINYPAKSTMFDNLMNEMQGNSYADKQLRQALGEYYIFYSNIQHLHQRTGIQASMPYFLTFNL
jgi:protease-4